MVNPNSRICRLAARPIGSTTRSISFSAAKYTEVKSVSTNEAYARKFHKEGVLKLG